MKGYTINESINLLEKAVAKGGGGGGSETAADISYDNTSSGLTADDVQEAIDEVAGDIVKTAAEISYDNTSSGLTADDVQEALDEIDNAVDTLAAKVIKFGTPVAETISNLNTVGAKHTFVNGGIAVVTVETSGSSLGYVYFTVNGVTYNVETPGSYTCSTTIAVNAGDELEITQLSANHSITYIKVIPLELATPSSSRSKKKGGK